MVGQSEHPTLRAMRQRSQNLRTGLVLAAAFAAMLIGSVLYISVYH